MKLLKPGDPGHLILMTCWYQGMMMTSPSRNSIPTLLQPWTSRAQIDHRCRLKFPGSGLVLTTLHFDRALTIPDCTSLPRCWMVSQDTPTRLEETFDPAQHTFLKLGNLNILAAILAYAEDQEALMEMLILFQERTMDRGRAKLYSIINRVSGCKKKLSN